MLKLPPVIKRFFLLFITAAVFSCNDNKQVATVVVEEKSGSNSAKKDKELIDLSTARSIPGILAQSWVMADDAEALEGMDEKSKFEIPYRSFYFSPDGSMVKNPRNTFDHGSWKFDEASKTITINTVIEKEKTIYKIARITPDELVLVNTGIGSSTNLKFISQGVRFKDPADEPFHIDNNRWRIKPKVPETDSALLQRLKQHLHFYILFYRSVLAKNDPYVSFWGLPSCYKWYSGGIFIKRHDELKANWINCFYNVDQAMKAHEMAASLLNEKYNWPKGENWLKQNLAVLEQMYVKVDGVL